MLLALPLSSIRLRHDVAGSPTLFYKRTWNISKYFFKKQQQTILDWLAKEEMKQDCTHVDHDQLDDPLPFKIMCIKIILPFSIFYERLCAKV